MALDSQSLATVTQCDHLSILSYKSRSEDACEWVPVPVYVGLSTGFMLPGEGNRRVQKKSHSQAAQLEGAKAHLRGLVEIKGVTKGFLKKKPQA